MGLFETELEEDYGSGLENGYKPKTNTLTY